MQWETTDVLAWWGAIIATLVLVWDILKWRKDRVNLSVKIIGIDVPVGQGIRCEISNRGGKATTIIDVMLVTYQDNPFLRLIRMAKITKYLSASMNLPSPLAPGAVWKQDFFVKKKSDLIPFGEDYWEQFQRGKLYYKIKFSHSGRYVRGRVKKEGISDLFG